MAKCQWLDSSGCRCKKQAIDEFIIFKDPELRNNNESWFLVNLCEDHRQSPKNTYSRICKDYEVINN